MNARAEDLRVALGERAGRAHLAALGGVLHQELGLVDLLFEASVDGVEMVLFDAKLAVADRIRGLVPTWVRIRFHR